MPKTYTKKEISQILSKASEIQTQLDFDIEQRGLTEQELSEIADELGISSKALELAKTMPVYSSTDFTFNWLIGTSELQKVTFLPEEISKEKIQSILIDLGAMTGKKGTTESMGKAVDWEQKEHKMEDIRRITFNPDEGVTKITHYVNWDEFRQLGLGFSAFFGGLFLIIVLKNLGFSKAAYFSLSLFGALGGYSLFMLGLHSYFNKQKKRFKKITQFITTTLSKSNQGHIRIEEAEDFGQKSSADKNKLTH